MEDKPQAAKAGRANASDVARLAGVSSATVSRTLNQPEQVDPETRARVQQAVTLLRSPSQAWLRIEVTSPVGSVGDLSLRMN